MITNQRFLLAVLAALAALGLAVLVLSMAHALVDAPGRDGGAQALPAQDYSIAGARLVPRVMGEGGAADGAALIRALDDGWAVLEATLNRRVDGYSRLVVTTSAAPLHIDLFLYWRPANASDTYHVPMQYHGSGVFSAFPGEHPQWTGRVATVAIGLDGELGPAPMRVHEVRLQAEAGSDSVAGLLARWWEPRGWTHRSINGLEGVNPGAGPAPTPLIALWTGLACGFLWLLGRFAPIAMRVAVATAVLVPWLVLDMFWQRELVAQAAEARRHFAGKMPQDKLLASADRKLYRYLQRLQRDLLPPPPARLFLVHQSEGHNYWRLRAQYFLLPHNVYNYGRMPPAEGVHAGDYVLVLDDAGGGSFDAASGMLSWPGQVDIPVTRLDREALGQLFLVRPPGEATSR